MELIVFFFIIIAALSSSGNQKKRKAQQQRTKQAVSALRNQIVPPNANRRASADPGRVSAASVARNNQKRTVMDGQTLYRGKPQSKRERFERESAYENSNVMDVRYTANGCGCTTGKGNASSGSRHGKTSAIYDEARFFKESREICSGNWS